MSAAGHARSFLRLIALLPMMVPPLLPLSHDVLCFPGSSKARTSSPFVCIRLHCRTDTTLGTVLHLQYSSRPRSCASYSCASHGLCCQVSEYDCLLLEHVFGQRPADSAKVRNWVLETLASDPGLQQTELLFLGLFGRACRLLEERDAQVCL